MQKHPCIGRLAAAVLFERKQMLRLILVKLVEDEEVPKAQKKTKTSFERRTVAADAGDATDGRDHHCARRLAHRVYRDWGVSECITLDHQVRARVR